MKPLMSALLGLFVFSAQRAEVIWDAQTLTSADRRAILELAGKAGIRNPQKVSQAIRPYCGQITVESRPTVNGNRATTNAVSILDRSAPGCKFDRGRVAGQKTEESGDWIVVYGPSNPTRFEYWRISEDVWHVDLPVSADVPYEVVRTVVLALRHGTFVDVRTGAARWPFEEIDPSAITGFGRDRGVVGVIVVTPPLADGYEVTVGRSGGYLLTVVVRDGRVELHAVRGWES